jgi:hypothetical protein
MACKWPEYHLLDCLGFFIDDGFQRGQKGPRYGIIYRLPESSTSAEPFQSLRDVIASARQRAPLRTRLHIAKELVTALCYLLSVGWFHKALNAINLLLLESPGALPQVKLVGFEFARPDQPAQRSLDPKDDKVWDLYRHKDCRTAARQTAAYSRRGYQKIFDIYSVGILLVEIGQWQSILDIETKKYRRWHLAGTQPFDSYLISTEFLSELGMKTKPAYAEAMKKCLTASFNEKDDNGDATLIRKFEKAVVQALVDMNVSEDL